MRVVAKSLFDEYRERVESLQSAALLDSSRVIHTKTSEGEPMLLVMRESPLLDFKPSLSFDYTPPEPNPYMVGQRFGGFVQRDPARLINVVSEPRPDAPGVEAMLADGWTWNGNDAFIRGEADDRWPWRYSGRIAGARVVTGRYADRLPTNRKRKRERAKERRRESRELPASKAH